MPRLTSVIACTLLALLTWGGAPAGAASTGERLQTVLDEVVAQHRLVPGAVAYVDAPREGLPWSGASGRFAFTGSRPLRPEDPYRIASSTKIFTAASILRLAEQGRLSLEDSIARWLPPRIVDRIHVLDGRSYGPEIKLRQLLNHTSGIFSHDEDPRFLPLVAAQPTKRWTAEEEIEMSIDNEPYFPPGRGWHYSDTAYVMLGLIIQRATGQTLGPAVRDLLRFDRLGLRSTWWELFEDAPAGAGERARQYFKALDATDYSPSWDSWGGGGLVSTTSDATRFIRALFEGRVFERASTLTTMLADPAPVPNRGFEYAYEYAFGIGHWRVGGVDCWGHPGWWSAVIHYCPSLDLAFATTTNQASDEHDHHTETFVAHGIVRAVREARPREATRSELRVSVRPSRVLAGSRTRFRFRVTTLEAGRRRPVPSATVRFGGRRVRTDRRGRASLVVTLRRPGRYRAIVRRRAGPVGVATVRTRR